MNVIIRQEEERDYSRVKYVVEKAFESAEYSDHKEQLLVERLRKSDAFISELSLIAELNKEIIGHAMLTKLIIRNGKNEYESLALAPVSVLPQYQNIGIGIKLINESLKVAKQIGFKSVIVLGHDQYYPRFGFMPARTWGIECPFEVPNESFMALELERDSLSDVDGTVIYPNEFFE